MSQIPENEVTMKDVEAWYVMQEQLRILKQNEMLMRMRIFKYFFPAPKEGTNNFDLPDGYQMKAVHPIERKVDEAALDSMKEKFKEEKVNTNKLIKWKPEVVIKEYRTLTDDQRHLFDQALIVKPGSPQVSIVLPKR